MKKTASVFCSLKNGKSWMDTACQLLSSVGIHTPLVKIKSLFTILIIEQCISGHTVFTICYVICQLQARITVHEIQALWLASSCDKDCRLLLSGMWHDQKLCVPQFTQSVLSWKMMHIYIKACFPQAEYWVNSEQMFVSGKFVDCDPFWLFESEVRVEQQRKDIKTFEHGINKHTVLLIKVCSI